MRNYSGLKYMRKYAFILNVYMIQRKRYLDKLILKKENGLVKIIKCRYLHYRK